MVKYYKETHYSIQRYALKIMQNIFGQGTSIKRIAEYFEYPEWKIESWINNKDIPEEIAIAVIEDFTREKAEDFITEKTQSIDFILSSD